MQWFQRKNQTVLCGIDYIKAILKHSQVQDLHVEGLEDGTLVDANEPVLKITGKYCDFAHFEGLFDGILSRASSVATAAARLKKAANNKTIINMNDRMDVFSAQQIDGYASIVGGIENLVTPASFEYVLEKPILNGTMPHALIAAFDGDLVAATNAYLKTFPNHNLVALIDYNNDCITDGLKVAQVFQEKLFAVRLDTSKALVDKSLEGLTEVNDELHGVNPTLVKMLRQTFDDNGFKHIKIIASSGFDEAKITWFEAEKTPVDIYGVGEALTKTKIHFTGDLVQINGKDQSKFGRKNTFSSRLKSIKY
ncbi:nicotinate phosphoribosyltransferase [Spiroplasma clarkii]|nr:nicotinate phosphoribosyltransferase [Spiroplasma clarkii]ARU91163.1 nicotinate phosphoribosyltransferase [Spiroplasma clarkii]